MHSSRKKSAKKITKYILAGALTFGLTQISASVMAQSPPPPPPPPNVVLKKAGDGLKKINPFKNRKKHKAPPAPGTPPDPLKIFKKRPPAPPAPPKPPGL